MREGALQLDWSNRLRNKRGELFLYVRILPEEPGAIRSKTADTAPKREIWKINLKKPDISPVFNRRPHCGAGGRSYRIRRRSGIPGERRR